MEIRPATLDDGPTIRDVVQRSMEASYSMGPSTIEAAVKEWFGEDTYEEKLEDDDYRLFVAEENGNIVGMTEVVVAAADAGDIDWIHVDPDYRGEGIGEALFERAREALDESDVEHVRGIVLANNADGTGFYRELGFERVDSRELDIDGSTYIEYLFHEEPLEEHTILEDEGTNVYVDESDATPGAVAPFYRAYADAELETRYGYQCGHCGSLANAMDAMGRIECGDCGNTRKPTRWDAAYM